MKCFKCGFSLSEKRNSSAECQYSYLCIDKSKIIVDRWQFNDPWHPFQSKLNFDRAVISNTIIKKNGVMCDYCGVIVIKGPSFLINERSAIPKVIKNSRKNKYGSR